MRFFSLQFVQDIVDIDETLAFDKIAKNTSFSTSYLILLIGSSIVCTLGLILDSTAIVIGGMIIAPVMWPLVKTSLGISYEKRSYIREALLLLIISILLGIVTSSFIALLSPIKILNQEILARTTPTLFDIFIALVAGCVAALAIADRRISESLAGVAIATSLMPPLCVSGIGLALNSTSTFIGALLLFLANVVSIIFIVAVIFSLLGLRRNTAYQIRRRGLIVVSIILILTAVPLFNYLQRYSLQLFTYNQTEEILQEAISQISSQSTVENFQTELSRREGNNIVVVRADIMLPENVNIDFTQRENLVRLLEDSLGQPVDLQLELQQTLSIISEADVTKQSIEGQIEAAFINILQKISDDFVIDTLNISQNSDDNTWQVDTTILSDPNDIITITKRNQIEADLIEQTNQNIVLNLNMLSRVQFPAEPDELKQTLQQEFERIIERRFPSIDIDSYTVDILETPDSDGNVLSRTAIINATLLKPVSTTFTQNEVNEIKASLENSNDAAALLLYIETINKEEFLAQ